MYVRACVRVTVNRAQDIPGQILWKCPQNLPPSPRILFQTSPGQIRYPENATRIPTPREHFTPNFSPDMPPENLPDNFLLTPAERYNPWALCYL